jgi:hypothetical protein
MNLLFKTQLASLPLVQWVLKEQIVAWLLDAAFPLIRPSPSGRNAGRGRRVTRKRLSPIPLQVCLPSGERVSLPE